MSATERAGKAPRVTAARRPKPPLGKPWAPGQSGNPAGKSKQLYEIEALARSKCPEAIEQLARLARGRGLPAVRAAETLLLFGLGRPAHSVSITAKGAPMNGAFAGGARAMLEAAIANAETSAGAAPGVIDVQSVPISAVGPSATVPQTVALHGNPESSSTLMAEPAERGPTTAPADTETGGAP